MTPTGIMHNDEQRYHNPAPYADRCSRRNAMTIFACCSATCTERATLLTVCATARCWGRPRAPVIILAIAFATTAAAVPADSAAERQQIIKRAASLVIFLLFIDPSWALGGCSSSCSAPHGNSPNATEDSPQRWGKDRGAGRGVSPGANTGCFVTPSSLGS